MGESIKMETFCPFSFQYECKVQNLKKRKVTVQVSVDGVKVSLKKKKRKVITGTSIQSDQSSPLLRFLFPAAEKAVGERLGRHRTDAASNLQNILRFPRQQRSQDI